MLINNQGVASCFYFSQQTSFDIILPRCSFSFVIYLLIYIARDTALVKFLFDYSYIFFQSKLFIFPGYAVSTQILVKYGFVGDLLRFNQPSLSHVGTNPNLDIAILPHRITIIIIVHNISLQINNRFLPFQNQCVYILLCQQGESICWQVSK